MDFAKIKKLMKIPLIIDGRNTYEPKRLKRLGFTYIGMGIARDTLAEAGRNSVRG